MESPAARNPNWLDLPRELTASILHRLGAIELLETAQKVCTTWRNICKDPAMWRTVDMRNSGRTYALPYNLEKMTMHAVDLSCGQLEVINIENFVGFVDSTSSQLKRLRLVRCYDGISPEAFSEAFKKLPLLEELHLYFTVFDKQVIEVAGRFCTLLKSFKLNIHSYEHPRRCDDEALAIAESMPELRNLQLFGNKMTDDGLRAILDKCPHLESLDLRQCFNVTLAGDVGNRCFERIKDLKRPLDSTDGCGFHTELFPGEFDSDFRYGYAPADFPLVYDKADYDGATDSSDIDSLDYDGASDSSDIDSVDYDDHPDPNHPDY
ncbi:hypothetical protein RJ640_015935 [Escallonia rubra]|uniref:F-box domain-containing protein n=1 Tax=Escallonia rubra TaxID=112253 RepID=A0AA88UDL0_9ASTE|nr:hypothetical protein RJ640_015935 [Escallonia rubra]